MFSRLNQNLSEKIYLAMKKFRIGNYRVVFDIVGDVVRIQRIGNRKDVYRN
jgi:mRNA-degrading endonuclease RelE of RelBE toxin-antitoxin system